LVEAALRDEPFYRESTIGRGGVTLSGGEPLQQWEAAFELSRRLRARGVHVTLDTSAYAPREIIERIPDTFDLAIVDLKAVSAELHRSCTGVDNAEVLAAIRFLASQMTERLWISVPLIPGVQNSAEIARIEAFIRRLGPGPKARITPSHQLGDAKYRALGLDPPRFDRCRPVPEPRWQSDPNVPVSLADRGRDNAGAGPAPA
jgi:pyruvate formate lyase activating enzyme